MPTGDILFRTYLEEYWASKFKLYNIKYEYEKFKINIGDTTYIPDFYFPESDIYFEAKGHHKWEGSSMNKATKACTSREKNILVIKGTSEGTFHIANHEKSSCFIVLCPKCKKTYFTANIRDNCIYCHNIEIDILENGDEGLNNWEYINDENWLFSKKDYDHMFNTLSDNDTEQIANLYEKLHGKPKSFIYTRGKSYQISQLRKDHPNKQNVITFIENVLDILELTEHNEIFIPPLLLIGSPGCGKTAFAKKLSKILMEGKTGLKLDLNTGSANFTLIGNAKGFKSAYPGKILLSLTTAEGKPIKNPVILLDEIDKIKQNQYSCEDIFLTLLEKENSRDFRDEFFNIPIDSSGISYIALANNEKTIPEPVFNRFNVFYIRDYSEKEIKNIVIPQIYNSWVIENKILEKTVPDHLPATVIEEIYCRSRGDIRKIKNILYEIGAETIDINESNGVMAFQGKRLRFISQELDLTMHGIKDQKIYNKSFKDSVFKIDFKRIKKLRNKLNSSL